MSVPAVDRFEPSCVAYEWKPGLMAYAYQASSGVNHRFSSGVKSSSISSRFMKGASFAAFGVVAAIALAVTSLSATSVSTRTNDARRGGLADLMLSKPLQQYQTASARNFKGRKFDRIKLQPQEDVSQRFASANDAAVENNPMLKGFELAMITQPAFEDTIGVAKAEPNIQSKLLAPVETAAVAAADITGSIPRKSAESAPLQVAKIETKNEENPFVAVLSDLEDGIPLPAARPKRSQGNTQLAYAAPDAGMDEVLPEVKTGPKLSRGVAIYDITAQKVYLPDGKIMEAHSGLGNMRDNPKYIKVKGRGPTPPNRYKLSMREKLFHGVPALRLTPQDWDKMHGRNGILAHTYLRRRPGDSAGCIAFKDYYKFLAYYKKGLVKEIIVVERMSERPTTLASLFGNR